MTGSQGTWVLVIDDDEQVRDLMSDLLGFLGYRVDLARTGDEGVAMFARQRHEVVVTDLQMPGISGWEVVERVRAIDPEVRVVMCTAVATCAVVERARLDEIPLLGKPVRLDELQAVLRPRLSGSSGLPVGSVASSSHVRRWPQVQLELRPSALKRAVGSPEISWTRSSTSTPGFVSRPGCGARPLGLAS